MAEINGNTSDGYHTFNELYEFRKLYNAALFNEWAKNGNYVKRFVETPNAPYGATHKIDHYYQAKYDVHKSLCHYDGERCFDGTWFVVVAMLPGGQITNHYKVDDWDLFNIPSVDKAKYKFDNHTSQDVLERLTNLCKTN